MIKNSQYKVKDLNKEGLDYTPTPHLGKIKTLAE